MWIRMRMIRRIGGTICISSRRGYLWRRRGRDRWRRWVCLVEKVEGLEGETRLGKRERALSISRWLCLVAKHWERRGEVLRGLRISKLRGRWEWLRFVKKRCAEGEYD